MSLRTIRTSNLQKMAVSQNQLSGGAQFAMWLAFTGRDMSRSDGSVPWKACLPIVWIPWSTSASGEGSCSPRRSTAELFSLGLRTPGCRAQREHPAAVVAVGRARS